MHHKIARTLGSGAQCALACVLISACADLHVGPDFATLNAVLRQLLVEPLPSETCEIGNEENDANLVWEVEVEVDDRDVLDDDDEYDVDRVWVEFWNLDCDDIGASTLFTPDRRSFSLDLSQVDGGNRWQTSRPHLERHRPVPTSCYGVRVCATEAEYPGDEHCGEVDSSVWPRLGGHDPPAVQPPLLTWRRAELDTWWVDIEADVHPGGGSPDQRVAYAYAEALDAQGEVLAGRICLHVATAEEPYRMVRSFRAGEPVGDTDAFPAHPDSAPWLQVRVVAVDQLQLHAISQGTVERESN